MGNVTIIILIVIAVGVVLAVVGRGQRPVSLSEVDALLSQWKGWVEVSNSEFKPMFQGMILGKAEGWDGILLTGVLIEEHIPAPLAEAIKGNSPVYDSDGRILVRCLSAHDQDFIVSQLEQEETISQLQRLITRPDQINTRIVLNSVYLDYMDNPEGIGQFDTIWTNSTDATELNIRQVSSESEPSASPDEPSM